ncbi:MAG: hypothetical protein EOO00_13505 [Chitinophagaceae bacterium]|nr:MAG: hypothetical protein EOO00_13505 [Chitinophagaceae bacterium]
MSSTTKKIFLGMTVVVPFLIYCVVYYTPMIRNAPFKASEFVSIEYSWGPGNDQINKYNSATGNYQYVNQRDSLVKTSVKLRQNEMIYLHSKANELGFWNLPDLIATPGTDINTSKALRYTMTMKYQRKTKTVVFLTDYSGSEKLKDVAGQMQKLFFKTINDAEERYGK